MFLSTKASKPPDTLEPHRLKNFHYTAGFKLMNNIDRYVFLTNLVWIHDNKSSERRLDGYSPLSPFLSSLQKGAASVDDESEDDEEDIDFDDDDFEGVCVFLHHISSFLFLSLYDFLFPCR